MNARIDVRDLLPQIRVPTLVLHRTDDNWIGVGHGRYLAERIPGARYVELPGTDHRPWVGDVTPMLTEVEVFLTGRTHRPKRRATIGLDALSRCEREVALLASRARPPPRSPGGWSSASGRWRPTWSASTPSSGCGRSRS
jgi:hypothetical protein